ncbi:MAG TPA: ABC transporter substrate-binding protein [Chloroflexota bacterium]|nr:ABC transporter substrate-binding protein [Chloroflexota bacterium]
MFLLAACGSAPAASPASSVPASAPAISPKTSASRPASAAGSAASSAGSAAASGLLPIKAAYSQVTASQGVLYTAVDQKFFQKYGLDVTATQINGTQQVPAIVNGELQFGTPGGNELLTANAGGEQLVMLAASSNVPVLSLYGMKGITDVKQLAGKAVAVTTAGSATDAAAKLFLKHYGLDQQVKTQPAGSSQAILAVLLNGDAAGGILAPPTSTEAEKAGLKQLVNGPTAGVPFVEAGTAVTRSYLQSNPDVVKRYMEGYYAAWKFATDKANEAAVEQTIVKWTKTDMATAKIAYDYLLPAWSEKGMPEVSLDGLKSIAEISPNPKAKDVDLNKIVDNSILQAIEAGH